MNKKAEPSPKMAKKIADNLNVDMEELFVYRTKGGITNDQTTVQ